MMTPNIPNMVDSHALTLYTELYFYDAAIMYEKVLTFSQIDMVGIVKSGTFFNSVQRYGILFFKMV
jgi:hypothetical protein